MQDIAQSMGNSLSRDGLGGMRANLAMGGNKITGLGAGAVDTDAATIAQLTALAMPIGSVLDYAGAAAPTGFLLCYGQAISRTDYADLFAVLGITFGAGDGTTTFNVPDARGRVAAGKDNMGGTSANRLTGQPGGLNGDNLAAAGGAETVTLALADIPSHNHGVTDPGHTHQLLDSLRNSGGAGNTSPGGLIRSDILTTQSATTGITVQNNGGGGAHNNLQPTIIFNKIIKASL